MEKKNNSGMLVGILIGLVIALLVVGGLFATGTISFKQTTTTDNGQSSNSNKKSIKVYDSKDFVYDAEYKYDNKYTKYDDSYNEPGDTIDGFGISIPRGKNDISTLKVPYINVNSTEATTANNKLKEIYLKYAMEFDKYAEESEKNDNGPICHQILNYKKYQYNDIVSVLVFYDTQCTSPFVFNYLVYNFDLKTGKLLSYDDILSKLSLDKNTVLNNLKNNAKAKMDSAYNSWGEKKDLTTECHYNKDENGNLLYGTSNCYDITYTLLQKSIDSNSLLYFVDNDGDLNVMMILYLAFAQNGDRNHYLVKASK